MKRVELRPPASAKPTCKYCGRVLRRPTYAVRVRVEGPNGAVHEKTTGRRYAHDKPGRYGDGHFCGLTCGYRFGVQVANLRGGG